MWSPLKSVVGNMLKGSFYRNVAFTGIWTLVKKFIVISRQQLHYNL